MNDSECIGNNWTNRVNDSLRHKLKLAYQEIKFLTSIHTTVYVTNLKSLEIISTHTTVYVTKLKNSQLITLIRNILLRVVN